MCPSASWPRVLAGEPDEATQRAVEYAQGLGVDELRAVHFGERDWDDDDLGIPVDDAPLDGRSATRSSPRSAS